MRLGCIKLESVALAAAAGALNPFALGGALVKAEKANRQLQRAYSLGEGSRAAKRTALRSDKSRASAWKELTSWAAIEGGTEGFSNLIPDDLHIRVGDQSTQCGCNGQ